MSRASITVTIPLAAPGADAVLEALAAMARARRPARGGEDRRDPEAGRALAVALADACGEDPGKMHEFSLERVREIGRRAGVVLLSRRGDNLLAADAPAGRKRALGMAMTSWRGRRLERSDGTPFELSSTHKQEGTVYRLRFSL